MKDTDETRVCEFLHIFQYRVHRIDFTDSWEKNENRFLALTKSIDDDFLRDLVELCGDSRLHKVDEIVLKLQVVEVV
jgi:hypothetical protein